MVMIIEGIYVTPKIKEINVIHNPSSIEHNLFKNVSKKSLLCDKHKFKRLSMALMMSYG